jgi:hypothetical protein
MKMIAHDTPAMNQQAFILPAIPEAIQNYVPVLFPRKDIYPLNNSKSHKMDSFLVPYFIST